MTVARALFMGSDPIALPLLERLAEPCAAGVRVEWLGVYTQPDRRHGRGMRLRPNAIKAWAVEHGLPVYQPERCAAEEAERIAAQGVDLLVVMAYGQLLPQAVLQAARVDTVNLHASLLPRLRGASPIHTALAQGYSETGVSLMRITRKMDAGPVAAVERVAITADMTLGQLWEAMATAAATVLADNLAALLAGTLAFTPQDESAVSYCRILEKADSALDFRVAAVELARRVRAFRGSIGTRMCLNGEVLKIHAARSIASERLDPPGTVHCEDGRLWVQCGDGALEILEIQRPGGKALDTAAFLRGYKLAAGARCEIEAMPPLESAQPFRRAIGH